MAHDSDCVMRGVCVPFLEMSFNQVAGEVSELYGRGDFIAAMALVQGARSRFPEEDNTLTFWEACLLSRTGRLEEALGVLEGGLARGEWWPPGMLADEDLDPLRELPRWEPILQTCCAIAAERMADRPQPLVRDGTEPGGTLVVIQGAQGIQAEVASTWSEVTPAEWTVVTPAAAEPAPDGGWTWPHSIEASAASVLDDLRRLSFAGPLVLGGFSIGSAITCHLALSGALSVGGLVVVAPSSRSRFDEIRQVAASGVPALVICGGQDMRVDHYRKLHTDLADHLTVTVELLPEMGHEYPPDMDRRVSSFLAGLSSAEHVPPRRDG